MIGGDETEVNKINLNDEINSAVRINFLFFRRNGLFFAVSGGQIATVCTINRECAVITEMEFCARHLSHGINLL